MALSRKQQRFVEEYCVDWNATQAAIRAGYSARTVNHNVSRMMVNDGIQAAIAARQQELAGQCAVTQERVIQELAAIAFSDIGHYCRWGPDGVQGLASDTALPQHRRAIKQLIQTVGASGAGTLRITLHDKVSALDKLAWDLGLYQAPNPDDPWQGEGLSSRVEAARQELREQLDALASRFQLWESPEFQDEVDTILRQHAGITLQQVLEHEAAARANGQGAS
jgi:phage terminase small subunit